jgi:hypothetical protein
MKDSVRCAPTFLFHLQRLDRVYWDQNVGLVVRAMDEAQAREFAAQSSADEGGQTWKDPTSSTCERLLEDGTPEVILISFRAG